MRYLFFISTLLLLVSCKNNRLEFDSKEWKSDKIGHNNVRTNMTEDLIDSKLLIGIKMDSVVNLLGVEYYPMKSDLNRKVLFTIKESYGFDIDPLYSSYLIVETDTITKTVLNVEFMETEDKRNLIEKMFTE